MKTDEVLVDQNKTIDSYILVNPITKRNLDKTTAEKFLETYINYIHRSNPKLAGKFINDAFAQNMITSYQTANPGHTQFVDFSLDDLDKIHDTWQDPDTMVIRVYFIKENESKKLIITGATLPDVHCSKEVEEVNYPMPNGPEKRFAIHNGQFITSSTAKNLIDEYKKTYNNNEELGTVYVEFFISRMMNIIERWKGVKGVRFYFALNSENQNTLVLIPTRIVNGQIVEVEEITFENQLQRGLDFGSLCPPDCNCSCDPSSLAKQLYQDKLPDCED